MNLSVSNESTPTNTPDFVRAILDKSIDEVIKTLYPPVMAKTIDKISFAAPQYHPVHRNTALNLHTLTRFIISMDGGSIDSELIKAGIPAKSPHLFSGAENWIFSTFGLCLRRSITSARR